MSQMTILVIDDSATIRRLADNQLSQAGYRVLLAPTAEDGLRMAVEAQPELILLDHQLPGTTGYEVCLQLRELDDLRGIPVVISSTLRKRAYAEYTELPNVVDMLPKPYTPELLKTTVANALDTGKIVVDSQSQGTAVPEVIQEVSDSALGGSFEQFGLREILDFLNNGTKQGVLEVETPRDRVRFFLSKGRIQAVSAAGTDVGDISETLPDVLKSLAPVLSFTVGGRFCSEVDGLVELLDKKVVDPRLLRKLLRHQAAVLTRRCFTEPLKDFRFEADGGVPPLFSKLPLDISTAALLVDAALCCKRDAVPAGASEWTYVRRVIRGQNLDRAGLSPTHMKLVGLLASSLSCGELARQLNLSDTEADQVLSGFVMAELVEEKQVTKSHLRHVLLLESDTAASLALQAAFEQSTDGYDLKVVRDRLALQLRLKRMRPQAVVLPIETNADRRLLALLKEIKIVQVVGPAKPLDAAGDEQSPHRFEESDSASLSRAGDAIIHRPYTAQQLTDVLNRLFTTDPATPLEESPLHAVASTIAAATALGS